jgi:uncharacterized protein (DUF488 family)
MSELRTHILYTIGHSNHSIEKFISLLKNHGITLVADVRSSPYSQYCTQFNKEIFSTRLQAESIGYIYLGEGLGGMSANFVDFKQMSNRQEFKQEITRLLEAFDEDCVALMCVEKDPIKCHRFTLVCRALKSEGLHIRHILEDGSIEEHSDAEERMAKMLNLQPTLFETDQPRARIIEHAYEKQTRKIYHRSTNTK